MTPRADPRPAVGLDVASRSEAEKARAECEAVIGRRGKAQNEHYRATDLR